jgi:hypothetical protein
MANTVTINVTVPVTVDLEMWALSYGMSTEEAQADAAEHVPNLVIETVKHMLEQHGSGATLSSE